MAPSDEAKQELFAFYRELEQNPKLKDLYFKANNRPDRKKIIESLGFDPALIQEAVDRLQIKVGGKTVTLAEWLAEKKIDPESLAPVRAVLNALNRVEQSGTLSAIVGGYGSYKAELDKTAGGAARLSKEAESINQGAKGVETEIEDTPEVEAVSDASSDVADIRNEFEQNESEADSRVSEVENTANEIADVGVDIGYDRDNAGALETEAINNTLSSIEQNIQADAIDQVYSLLVNESEGLQKELSESGINAEVSVTETYGESGNPSGAEIQVSGSRSVEKSEGGIELTAGVDASATIDIGINSGVKVSDIDLTGTATAIGTRVGGETNEDGSVTGEITAKDTVSASVEIDPSDSSEDSVNTKTSGLEIGVQGEVNESAKESYSEGPIEIDGTTTIAGTVNESIDVDLSDPTDSTVTNDGSSVEIDQELGLSGKESFNETNKYGSASGTVALSDDVEIDIGLNPTVDDRPAVKVSNTGLDINIQGSINESVKEDYSEGSISIDGTTTVTGGVDENVNIDLRDPSKSTADDEGNSLEVKQDLTVEGTLKGDIDGVELTATLGASAEADVDISDKEVSKNISLEDIDVGLKAEDTKPIEIYTGETVEGIVSVYAEPEAGVDLSIDPNTGKVDVTGKSVNPNLYVDVEPS
jgi:hypothetical protein